jgi:hypothetical protein
MHTTGDRGCSMSVFRAFLNHRLLKCVLDTSHLKEFVKIMDIMVSLIPSRPVPRDVWTYGRTTIFPLHLRKRLSSV